MSMNLCTDLLLLQLVPKGRIASVTYIAHDGAQALFPGADAGVAINHGTSEDIVNQRPDLILAADFSSPTPTMAKTLAKQIGARVVEVKSADNFADIRKIVRQVGDEVGEPERAAALIAHMDGVLADLAAHPPKRQLRVVAWSGGSSVPGKDTLTNAIVTAAGAVNIAALPGRNYSTFGVEELLAADPDALLYGGARSGKPSLHSDEGQHRVVRQLYGARRVAYNEAPHSCGLPQSADAARDLRRALDALPERRPIR
jgi:iron complex transport system substrate-binding protein